jgi:hypothetical protein
VFALALLSALSRAQDRADYPVNEHHIVYHDVKVDANGGILPWYSDDPSKAYDHDIRLVWNFWIHMRKCQDGVPYYLQHQVWRADKDDPRGLGGDQINMALDSWNLLYDYLGDPAVTDNMVLIADYWLDHGMSGSASLWPNVPFPYNTNVESGQYDGDMRAGKGFLQPDKAGSFGAELVMLYKKTGNKRYLNAAIKIADTLVATVTAGDEQHSPWPFRVDAASGKPAEDKWADEDQFADYTTNWTPALRLFDALCELHRGRTSEYSRVKTLVIRWLTAYPLKNDKWGPFFEDIPTKDYSDTEINADTMAAYLLDHPEFAPNASALARGILDWSYNTFANHSFAAIGVVPINEQTRFQVPGNSHTSRHASVELLYCEKTGSCERKDVAIRQLNWATYSVNDDGKDRYPSDDIWLTDGYGDYVRHYLRAMAASPELAPDDQNHLLSTSSTIQSIRYSGQMIVYRKFDRSSVEKFKIGRGQPWKITGSSMAWEPGARVLTVHSFAAQVTIYLR